MSDNFGSGQRRVINVQDRNLDNVICLDQRPPLTSEFNLINQIGNQKLQDVVRAAYPSGWLSVGEVLNDWLPPTAQTGQVICSSDFDPNTFKLISENDNIAIVNGWRLLVQGTNSGDNNNVITLPTSGGQKYDFVFMEVWRKLVRYSDSLYPYGNVDMLPYSNNEIYWPPVGAETTERVQIQYRIRVVSILTEITDPMEDILATDIHPIGGRTTGEYVYNSFQRYGPSDVGLYVAGDGSSASQTALNTVDGFVYAVPMFLVYRRVWSDYLFGPTMLDQTYTDKGMSLAGYVMDRPDGKVADVVRKEDIVDLRHHVLTSGKDLDIVVQRTVSKLLANELTTALKRGFDEDGAMSPAQSGGSTFTKVERLNSVGGDNIPNIGTGSSTSSTAFKRRVFDHAEYRSPHNVVEIPRPGSLWAAGTFSFTFPTAPAGEIISVDGYYNETVGQITGVSVAMSSGMPATVTVALGSNVIGQTQLLMEFTFKYYSSTSGFKDVPKQFLEINKGTKQPIATRDCDVLLRFNNAGDLLKYATVGDPTYNNGNTDSRDHAHYAGGCYTDNYDFGHDLVVYRTTSGASAVTLTLSDGKLNGYCILGVKKVEVETSPESGVFESPIDFTQERNITPVSTPSYAVNSYVVTVFGYPSVLVRITLCTGSKYKNDVSDPYSEVDSFKFFELSKQGRGIVETYEMIEVIAEEVTPGNYVIDTVDKPIIALATKTRTETGAVEAYPYAFLFNGSGASHPITPSDINTEIPVTTYTTNRLPTRIVVQCPDFSGQPKIRVPVLVHSYVTSTESSYNFYYRFNAYQGLLSATSSVYGQFMNEGPAVITTLGSGGIMNYIYDDGFATAVADSRTITGSDTIWSKRVRAGDLIRIKGVANFYKILSVDSDTQITLVERFPLTVSRPDIYTVVRIDVPASGIANVVDILPAFKINAPLDTDIGEHRCYSEDIVFGDYEGSILMTAPVAKLHDPLNAIVNDFMLGYGTSAKRGRNDLILSQSGNEAFRLALNADPRPYVKYKDSNANMVTGHYKKVYQVYLLNRSATGMFSPSTSQELTGRMYLAVISGEVDTENENMLDPYMNVDTIDLFELVGRPILKLN